MLCINLYLQVWRSWSRNKYRVLSKLLNPLIDFFSCGIVFHSFGITAFWVTHYKALYKYILLLLYFLTVIKTFNCFITRHEQMTITRLNGIKSAIVLSSSLTCLFSCIGRMYRHCYDCYPSILRYGLDMCAILQHAYDSTRKKIWTLLCGQRFGLAKVMQRFTIF